MGTTREADLVVKSLEDEGSGATNGKCVECLNCGAPVTSSYCANCGQALHVHRSIGAFWHDILHGVLHFEGKFWRTLPLLVWNPGNLTRRYVHGERAKFISPIALFLFSVFMMFAVFSFLDDPFSSDQIAVANDQVSDAVAEQPGLIDEEIKAKTAQLSQATPEERAKLEQQILDLKKGRNMMSNLTGEDTPYPDVSLSDGEADTGNLTPRDLDQLETGLEDIKEGNVLTEDSSISTGSSATDKWLREAFGRITANPDLLLYKLKANGYKFAWLLIPISLPLVWLTLIGRRGFHFYDHAIFATYSLSFMSLLFITCALLAAIGVAESIWLPLILFYPLFHMHRQLRHAYGLGKIETFFRLIALLVFTVISLSLFFAILLALGILG
ncbi:DUF3667 domain-containing protein [Parasphingorhabdus flavimaris]|uniref:DUF3667 domain-containing protein n=1 Tax=Parasphingorhabdus flavimaris TaxID=266812 RepID=A0ABX2MXZ0_9SPHN|nr:DUF3667 domain-containing protein [Parasphingorhabdus flavimaris]NVD26313.1 DUF3667 domain-containing protein [Parasphingorhabdus flavimaris]